MHYSPHDRSYPLSVPSLHCDCLDFHLGARDWPISCAAQVSLSLALVMEFCVTCDRDFGVGMGMAGVMGSWQNLNKFSKFSESICFLEKYM